MTARRTRTLCLIVFCLAVAVCCPARAAGGLEPLGRVYNQAQTLHWIDDDQFAVGRWDGTVTIFRRPLTPAETGPALVQAFPAPSRQGIEMVDSLPNGQLLTSNTDGSIAVWSRRGDRYSLSGLAGYDPACGMFNSGCLVHAQDRDWYVSGHAGGRVIRWLVLPWGRMMPVKTFDVRSPDPIPSPFPIKNVRGIVHWRDGLVVTGGEDGDLCLLDVFSGRILARTRYNPTARRGVNGLSIRGDLLLVTNCTVGTDEPNLSLFRIEADRLTRLDSRYVVSSAALPGVFSVDSALVPMEDQLHFYLSTGEGAIWHGLVSGDRLQVLGRTVTGWPGVAPVFHWREATAQLALADYDIRLYRPFARDPDLVRIALVHLAAGAGQVEPNRRRIEAAVDAASEAGADWILTPELAESGYHFAAEIGTDWIEDFPSDWLKSLARRAGERRAALLVGLPERDVQTGKLHNSVAVIDRTGTILGAYRKIHVIPGEAEGWATPGEATPLFALDGEAVGILICADSYTPEIAAAYARSGAGVLLSSAAWAPGSMGPNGCWEDRSRETGLPFLVCNRTGEEPGISFRNSESVVDRQGQRLFTFTAPGTTVFLVQWNRRTGEFTQLGSLALEEAPAEAP